MTHKMMIKNNIIALAVIAFFYSCKETPKEEVPQNQSYITVSDAQFNTMKMELSSPVERNFDVAVSCSGRIDVPPQNKAKVTALANGFVKNTKLLVGDKVTKGQALLSIQSTEIVDIQKEYLDVAEQISFLKSEYDRQKTLYNEKITSQKNYLKAASEYRSAMGRYQSLQQKLYIFNISPSNVQKGKIVSAITIFAPISGVVSVMNAVNGMAVSPTDVLLEIVNNNDLHIEMSVFEKDILKIKEEQTIKFTVPEASKDVFTGYVHLIGKSVEGEDRSINVHGHLDDATKQKLLSGMFVQANILVDSQKGFSVPKDAVFLENGKNYVLVLKSHQKGVYSFDKAFVEKGSSNEDFIEIKLNDIVTNKTSILTKGVFDIIN